MSQVSGKARAVAAEVDVAGAGGALSAISPGGDAAELASAVSAVLADTGVVLRGVSDEEYTRRFGAEFCGASMGGHVRHCLDHIRALVDGVAGGTLDYDHRERGTDVETRAGAAAAEVEALRAGLAALVAAHPGPGGAARQVTVLLMATPDRPALALESTLGRELAFVLSHTIHHNATIRGMLAALGRDFPAGFGYAPSTRAHLDAKPCAR